jgi:hypothetical protein
MIGGRVATPEQVASFSLHGAATPRTVWVGHVATGIVLQYISMLSMWAHLYDSMTTSLTRFVVRRMTHASEGAASIKPLRVQRVATPPSEKHPQSATITPICFAPACNLVLKLTFPTCPTR